MEYNVKTTTTTLLIYLLLLLLSVSFDALSIYFCIQTATAVPVTPVVFSCTSYCTIVSLFVLKHLAGQVIGVRGQTINRLMKESKAKIVLKPYRDNSGHDVVITGVPLAVQVRGQPRGRERALLKSGARYKNTATTKNNEYDPGGFSLLLLLL